MPPAFSLVGCDYSGTRLFAATWRHALFHLLLEVTPEPLVPPAQVDESTVWPGVEGFIATAVVAILAVLLIIDMVRRVRRVTYRSEIRERLEQERLESEIAGAVGDEPRKVRDDEAAPDDAVRESPDDSAREPRPSA